MTEVKGKVLQQRIVGQIFGGIGPSQLAALFGRNAVVFLDATEDSTSNLIDFAPVAGTVLPNTTGNNTLFIARMPFDKPAEVGIAVRIAALADEFIQLQTLAGDQIPDGAYEEGDYILFVRPGDANWAALTFFSGDLGGAGGGSPLVFLEPTEDSTATYLQLEPVVGTPSASGQNTLFVTRMAHARPPESGIIAKVIGVNDAEPFQMQTLGGDPVPEGAWQEGDYLLFARPEGVHFAMLDVFDANVGGGAGGGAVVYLEATEASTETHVVFAPAAGQSVSGTGQGRVFIGAMPFDRPPESGIIMTVEGVNDVEPFQFQTLGGEQLPEGAYSEGDFAMFVRPEGAQFKALQFFSASLGPEAPDPTDAIRAARTADNAARAAARARRTSRALDALTVALGFADDEIAHLPFAGGSLSEAGGALSFGSGLIDTRPALYSGDDLTLDFANGFYQANGERSRSYRSVPGFTFTRTGAKAEYVPGSRAQFVVPNVPSVVPGVGFWSRGAFTNLLLNSAVLATQSVTLTAAAHVLSFVGAGSVTLSGAASGTLTGTGATNRVSLAFTPSAGSVTFTVTGSVRLATLYLGADAGPIILTAGATATTAAERLIYNYSLDDEPWFVMVKVNLQRAAFTGRLLVISDQNSSNYLMLARTAGNVFDVRVGVGGVLQSVGLPTNPATETTGVCIVGLRRDAAGKYSAAWKRTDGVIAVGTPGTAAPMPPGLAQVDVGNFFGGDQPQCPIMLVRAIRGDLTDAQITAILGAS